MKKSRVILVVIGLTVLLISACSKKQKFDRALWKDGDGLEFKYRDNMLDDLLQNHKIKGLTWKQVQDTLGRPQGTKGLSTYYDIDIKYDGYPPSYMKRLFIDFNQDSVAVNTRIYEKTNRKKKK
ncbi:hypothetical protein EOD41_17460 [Mucilaginibacter limnophilus]|uniref:Uncharacterized protein n=1 Tax=Mucilaginibacter limnophilus TaxID=1932778 RepID=A0A3S2V696_9SPHI|nr:hypothetical protein [Mucilaginibacter limnophilus]RVT98159.1 hypothetical protein EOD41_17460 [Mucilaginibacter limnophilus]